MRKSTVRTIRAFGERIRTCREAKNWTQFELVAVTEQHGAPVALRTLQHAEQNQPVFRRTLRDIARALEIADWRELVAPTPLTLTPTDLLARAEEADRQGDHATASRLGRQLCEAIPVGCPGFLTARVRLATFLDHSHAPFEALDVLETEVFAQPRTRWSLEDQSDYFWALYQRGVIRRRCGETIFARCGRALPGSLLAAAADDLREVRDRGGDNHKAVAARHHLVILSRLLLGRKRCEWRNAVKEFDRCLEERMKLSVELGIGWSYEYRGLFEAHALLGQRRQARTFARLALVVARECANRRYENVITNVARAYGYTDLLS